MKLTCANCGSKLTFSAGKINISVEPCENCCSNIYHEDKFDGKAIEKYYEEETDD